MITWKKYEDYLKQDKAALERNDKYRKKTIEAGQRVQDLRAEYDAVLRREFAEGKDLTAEKDAVKKKIAEAETEYEYAQAEEQKATAYGHASGDRITIQQLVDDWNDKYAPAVREKELQPILDRMAEARDDYYKAILDYREFEREYNPLYGEFRDEVREYRRTAQTPPGGFKIVHAIANKRDLPRITDEELTRIQRQGGRK